MEKKDKIHAFYRDDDYYYFLVVFYGLKHKIKQYKIKIFQTFC